MAYTSFLNKSNQMNKSNKSNEIKLNVGFWGEGKTGVSGEKPLGAEISVWIYKNDAIELPLRSALSGRFFLARKVTI